MSEEKVNPPRGGSAVVRPEGAGERQNRRPVVNDAELQAMVKAYDSLIGLGADERQRVLRYLQARFGGAPECGHPGFGGLGVVTDGDAS